MKMPKLKPWQWGALAAATTTGIILGTALTVRAPAGKKAIKPSPGVVLPPESRGMKNVRRYLERTADVAGYGDDFVDFGMAVANRESDFNSRAKNDSENERAAACNLYHDSVGLYGAGREDEFCWGSGGWWGFLAATGMKPTVFRSKDPRVLIFDPAASTAMFADYVHRIIRDHFPKLPKAYRNWLSVRRSMASLKTMYAYDEPDTKAGRRARDVRLRLEDDLVSNGSDPDLMWKSANVGDYPGAGTVWAALREVA